MALENGESFITLRWFETVIGKTPENLRRTLEARGFPIRNVTLPNARGERRPTPAIHTDYLFAIIACADLQGMDTDERERLFRFQLALPAQIRKYLVARGEVIPNETHSSRQALDLQTIAAAMRPVFAEAIQPLVKAVTRLIPSATQFSPSGPKDIHETRLTTSDGARKDGSKGKWLTIPEMQRSLVKYLTGSGINPPTETEIDTWLVQNGMYGSPWWMKDVKRGDVFDEDALREARRHWKPMLGIGHETEFSDNGQNADAILGGVDP